MEWGVGEGGRAHACAPASSPATTRSPERLPACSRSRDRLTLCSAVTWLSLRGSAPARPDPASSPGGSTSTADTARRTAEARALLLLLPPPGLPPPGLSTGLVPAPDLSGLLVAARPRGGCEPCCGGRASAGAGGELRQALALELVAAGEALSAWSRCSNWVIRSRTGEGGRSFAAAAASGGVGVGVAAGCRHVAAPAPSALLLPAAATGSSAKGGLLVPAMPRVPS